MSELDDLLSLHKADDRMITHRELHKIANLARTEVGRLINRLMLIEEFVRNIRDNYDCDGDAHRHGTSCRCCEATAILLEKD